MNEQEFKIETQKLYSKVMAAFEDIDPDLAEADFHLDNIAITFPGNIKFIVNRQPPVHQIWLATKDRGLHFNFDASRQAWICDHSGEEFYETFNNAVMKIIKKPLNFG